MLPDVAGSAVTLSDYPQPPFTPYAAFPKEPLMICIDISKTIYMYLVYSVLATRLQNKALTELKR